jgi:phenylpyruvate tautomerase
MPYLSIRTNVEVEPERRGALLEQASQRVAEALGKSEAYVMVALADGQAMRFAGTDGPLAYLELKSIGLPESRTGVLSSTLCALAEEWLGVAKERVYIELKDVPRAMWGWNGGTF